MSIIHKSLIIIILWYVVCALLLIWFWIWCKQISKHEHNILFILYMYHTFVFGKTEFFNLHVQIALYKLIILFCYYSVITQHKSKFRMCLALRFFVSEKNKNNNEEQQIAWKINNNNIFYQNIWLMCIMCNGRVTCLFPLLCFCLLPIRCFVNCCIAGAFSNGIIYKIDYLISDKFFYVKYLLINWMAPIIF